MLLRLGEVEALYYFRGEWLSTLPSSFNNSKFCLILHGYGANAWDLASFAEYYGQLYPHDENRLWIFPQGFLELGNGNGSQSSRAWFPISIERLMMNKFSTDENFMNNQKITDREKIIEKFSNYFSLLKKINLEKGVLGGFSQGGMLAYHLLPKFINFFSLELLSLFSTLGIEQSFYQKEWENIDEKSLPALIQSHGNRDEVLNIKDGKKLYSFLEKYFKKSEFLEFNSGHTIPDNIIRSFFNKL